jgi:hypothetical protein
MLYLAFNYRRCRVSRDSQQERIRRHRHRYRHRLLPPSGAANLARLSTHYSIHHTSGLPWRYRNKGWTTFSKEVKETEGGHTLHLTPVAG